jgi:hypothetical protein
MIVEEDHGGGVGFEHLAHDLARVDGRAGDRAAEEDLHADEAVAGVEEQKPEDLVGERPDLMRRYWRVRSGSLRTGAPARKRWPMSAAAHASLILTRIPILVTL